MNSIRSWLYIGKYRDTLDPSLLASQQIEAMLLLADQVEQPGIRSLYLPVDKLEPLPPETLRQGIEFIGREKRQGHRILIAGEAGTNRSSAFAIAALREEEGLSLREAFRAVKQAHRETQPLSPIWESLCKYYEESVPYVELTAGK